jgi:transporter family-2 protein
VSGGNVLAAVSAFSAGVGGAIQAAVLGRLGERIGSVEAAVFSSLVAALTAVAFLLLARRSLHAYGAGFGQPVWLWTGGMLSAYIILTITFSTGRIGVAAAIGLVIAGQLALGAVIDRFGLFGYARVALHWPRVLGIALLAAGAALSLRR